MEEDSDEVVEAAEAALETACCSTDPSGISPSHASTASLGGGQWTTPLFHPSDVERVVQRYGQFIEKFQFNQARETIEQYMQSTSRPLAITNEKDVSWPLSYLLSLHENLVRASPSAVAVSDSSGSNVAQADYLIVQCRQYVLARVKMINIYTTITSLGNDREIVWESIHARGVRIAETLQTSQKHSLFSMVHLLSGEVAVLLLLVSAQIHISNCKMLESLLQLKEIRERFDFWVRDSLCLNSVNKSVLHFFRSTDKLPRNRLISWFVQFYNLLMAKFSLYFTNVLSNFCSVDDLKTIYTIDNGYNFISNATQLVKKTDAVCLAIVMDRENSTDNFYGFGYHRLKDRFTPGALTEPRKGIAALCPVVFRLPSPTEGHKSAQSNDVFEKYHEYINGFVQSNLRQPSKSRYYYDTERDHCMFGDMVEAQLYLVVVYSGRVCEKDVTIMSFIQHMTTSLRGSSLFLSLRMQPNRLLLAILFMVVVLYWLLYV